MLSKKLNLSDEQVLFYANEVVTKGWDRDLLTNAIKLKTHENQKPALPDNNFSTALPVPQANYANEVFRSSYNLGFLGITEPVAELELERRLVEKVKLILPKQELEKVVKDEIAIYERDQRQGLNNLSEDG